MTFFRTLGLLACLAIASAAYHATETQPARAAARAFAASLSSEQRAQAAFDFDDAERRDWHYVPRARRGVAIGALSAEQRTLAWALLRTGLSSDGLRKVDGVIALEGVLRDLEHNQDRDPGQYFVSLFGDLEGSGRFGWRFEGHHLSLNFAATGGSPSLSFTPQFFGANPATVHGGAQDGLRVLAQEEDLGRALVRSLDEAQRRVAIVSGAAPADVILGPTRAALRENEEGIRCADLTEAQVNALIELLDVYVSRQPAEDGPRNRARVLARPDELRFTWIGSLEPGEPHYYRIQAPSFAIEYDNVQGGANHVHTLWRDFERDFGDPLREHYEREHAK